MSAQQALTAIFNSVGAAAAVMPAGTPLWHCGIYQASYSLPKPLWCKSNSNEQNDYWGWAYEASVLLSQPAYKTEFRTNRDLHLFDCKQVSLLEFTRAYCNSNHPLLNEALYVWITSNGYDGIIAINGSATDVALVNPSKDLLVFSNTSILVPEAP